MGIVQIIIDDTTNKIISGSYSFDRGEGGILEIPHGTGFPGDPQANELFWRTDEQKLYFRNSSNTAWVLNLPTHASIHQNGGGDEVATITAAANAIPKAGAGGKLDVGWVPTGSSSTTVCAGNDSRLSDNRTDSTAIHKATSAEISAVTEKTIPVSADVLLIEDSEASYAKKRLTIGNFPGGLDTTAIHKTTAAEISAMTEKTTPVAADLLVIEDSAASNAKKRVQIGNLPSNAVFGKDYQFAAVDSRTTTTSDIFQTKTTLTTSALTGTYRIGWTAVIDLSTISAANVEAQLYNNTDATIVGALIVWRGTINQERACVGGFAEIVFTGAAKTFYIQYRSVNGTATAAIAAAKIEFWRVS